MLESDFAASYALTVTIDGIAVPHVIEVSGLKIGADTIETKQQTADGKFVVRQIPGRPKAGEFTVTRGLTGSKAVADWLRVVMEGDLAGARKTASVELLDFEGRVEKSYRFRNCSIVSVEVSSPEPREGARTATEKFTVRFDESEIA